MDALKIKSHGMVDDKEIVSRVLRGEIALFEIIIRRYNQTLYRVIRSYLSHDEDIEDVIQNTYLKAFEKLEQYRGASSFSTWLIRIGINGALMQIRNCVKEQKHLIDLDERSIKTMPAMHPEMELIQKEIRMTLERAIDSLPEKYRIIYMMREIEDLDFDEISDCLKVTSNNVKVRFHRAKGMLKEKLYDLSTEAEIFTFGNKRCDMITEKVMSNIT